MFIKRHTSCDFRYDRVLKEGANYAVGKGFAMGNMIGIIWLIIYMILSTAFAYGTKLYRDGEPGLEPGNVLIVRKLKPQASRL